MSLLQDLKTRFTLPPIWEQGATDRGGHNLTRAKLTAPGLDFGLREATSVNVLKQSNEGVGEHRRICNCTNRVWNEAEGL
jgi:hypothetical protein